MSKTGWVIVAVGVAYFFLTDSSAPKDQRLVKTDPLGQPNQPGPDPLQSPVSAYPWMYGSQYGNTTNPFVPFQGFGVNAKFTGTLPQNVDFTVNSGEVAPTSESSSYQRIGSAY